MNPVLSRLRARLGAASVESCNKDNCSLGLDGLDRDNRVIVDCDRYLPVRGRVRCDYVLFYDDGRVHSAPVEFKSGSIHASAILGQLQAGADVAASLTSTREVQGCTPVLLHRGIRRQEIAVLRRRPLKVQFRGRPFTVLIRRCGSQFTDLVSLPQRGTNGTG